MPVSRVSSRSSWSCSSSVPYSHARHAFCSSASSQRGAATAVIDQEVNGYCCPKNQRHDAAFRTNRAATKPIWALRVWIQQVARRLETAIIHAIEE